MLSIHPSLRNTGRVTFRPNPIVEAKRAAIKRRLESLLAEARRYGITLDVAAADGKEHNHTKPAPARHVHGWDSYSYINTAYDLRLVSGFNLLLRAEDERRAPYWQTIERMDDLPEDDPLEDLLDDDLLGVPIGYKSLAALYLSLQEIGEWLDVSLEDFIGIMESLEAFETDDLGDE